MERKENQGFIASQCQHKKTYMRYTREMRIRLIQLVDQEGLSTAEAARIVGIKQTSACRIMKSYHLHRRIFERRNERIVGEAGESSKKQAGHMNSQKTKLDSKKQKKQLKLGDEANNEKREQSVSVPKKEMIDSGSIDGPLNPSSINPFFYPPILNPSINHYACYVHGPWGFPSPFFS